MKLIEYTRGVLVGGIKMMSPKARYIRNMMLQNIYFYTSNTIGVTVFVSVFISAALTSQLIPELEAFGTEVMAGNLIMISMSREIGPILLGIILAGRMGSSMTAELGSMNTSNQIDSLKLMAVNPVHFLVVPRIIAATVISPFLFMVFISLIWLVLNLMAMNLFDISYGDTIASTASYFSPEDLIGGIMKSAIFGFIISLISCYKGIYLKGRSGEIGKATTDAVALSIASIIVVNLIITYLFFL